MASSLIQNAPAEPSSASARQEAEKRSAGKAAPEIDAETGQMINPHNPAFITNAPWYLAQQGSSLKHQRNWKADGANAGNSLAWYQRGTKGDVKTKFVKGACRNCGATTHTEKDCMERPRASKAVFTGEDLAPDEYVQEGLQFDYDTKRDRWNGFEAEDYTREVIEKHALREEVKQRKREQEQKAALARKKLKKKQKELRRQERRNRLGNGTTTGGDDRDSDSDSDSDADSDSDEEGDKLKGFENENSRMTGSKDDRQRTTTRNLRIREDTAKYLLNLDVNSAYYDPKSRSMRMNPRADLPDSEQHAFRGDNFVRTSGEANEVVQRQLFAWESYKHGSTEIHDQAAPTQASRMHEEFLKRKEEQKNAKRNELLSKYGGAEHLDVNPALIFAQTSDYQEYSRSGRVLHERRRALAKSSVYEEDVMERNHTSVWGSWYDVETGKWGFACCHSCVRESDCIPLKEQETTVSKTESSSTSSPKQLVAGEGAASASSPKLGVAPAGTAWSSSGGDPSTSSTAVVSSATSADAQLLGKKDPSADGKERLLPPEDGAKSEQPSSLEAFRQQSRSEGAENIIVGEESKAPAVPPKNSSTSSSSRSKDPDLICEELIEPVEPVEQEAGESMSFFGATTSAPDANGGGGDRKKKDSTGLEKDDSSEKRGREKAKASKKKRNRSDSSSSSSSDSSSSGDSSSDSEDEKRKKKSKTSGKPSSSTKSKEKDAKEKKTTKKSSKSSKKRKASPSDDDSSSSSSDSSSSDSDSDDRKKKRRSKTKKADKKKNKDQEEDIGFVQPARKKLKAQTGIQSGMGLEDEMAEFEQTRIRAGDPMAAFLPPS